MAHCHYTVDIVLAYYITTNLFRAYHNMANGDKARQRPILEHFIWFPILYYFESQIVGAVPRRYEWPLPSIKWCYLRLIRRENAV